MWPLFFILGILAAIFAAGVGIVLALVGAILGAVRGGDGGRLRSAARWTLPGLALALTGGLLYVGLEVVGTVRHHRFMHGRVVLWEWELRAYHSPRHFTGDGFSHERVRLPSRVCKAIRADGEVLAGLPDWGDGEPHESYELVGQHWVPTPLTQAQLEALDGMHHDAYQPDAPPELVEWEEQLDQALQAPGSVAAWWLRRRVYDSGGHVADLDLLLIELDSCEMVRVNHNT